MANEKVKEPYAQALLAYVRERGMHDNEDWPLEEQIEELVNVLDTEGD